MKIRTINSKDFKNFVSNAGNGKVVPQHYLDEETMTIKPKFDENGNRVTHNLYDDIQKFKDVNSLARILKIANGEDLENLSIICKDSKDAKSKSVDYTKIQDAEKVADFNNKLNSAGLTADDLMKMITNAVKKANTSAPEKKDVIVDKTKSPEKDVKKDETKK